jgi:hypothetical protein
MKVNRASASSMRSASVRSDGAADAVVGAPVSGIAPIAAAENGLSDEAPPRPFRQFPAEEEDAPESLIDAIDPSMVYRAAAALLRREGMIGLLLNRTA